MLEPRVLQIRPVQTVVKLQLKRMSQYYMANVVVVVLMLSLASLLAFAIDIEDNSGRLGVTLTLVLTSVAFKLLLADSLPRVAYMTMLDKYLLLSFVSLLLISAVAVIPYFILLRTGDNDFAWRVNLYLCMTGFIFMLTTSAGWLFFAQRTNSRALSPSYLSVIKADPAQRWHYYSFAQPHHAA